MSKKPFLLFAIILIQSVLAVEYLNPREAAMGGAATAVKDNQHTMFNNPAMLYYSKNGLTFPLFNNTVWMNDNLTETINKINKTKDSDKDEKIKKISELIPLNLGVGFHTNTSLVMNFPIKSLADKFAISGYSLFKFNAEVKTPISPEVNLRGHSDTIMPAISFAKKLNTGQDFFLEDVITGLTVKKVNRISLYNSDNNKSEIQLPLLALVEEENNSIKYGYQNTIGYGFDLGLSGKIPKTDINVALAVNNLSTRLKGTRYLITKEETQEDAKIVEEINTTAKVGACIENDWVSKFVPFIGYKIKEQKTKQKVKQILITTSNRTGNQTNPKLTNDMEVPEKADKVITQDITIGNDEQAPDKSTTDVESLEKITDEVTNNQEFVDEIETVKYAKTIYAIDFDIIAAHTSFLKRIHIGMEQPIFPFLNIRLGLNQGYGTAGINLNFFNKLHCGYTYYIEELGEFIGMKPASYHIYDFGFYW